MSLSLCRFPMLLGGGGGNTWRFWHKTFTQINWVLQVLTNRTNQTNFSGLSQLFSAQGVLNIDFYCINFMYTRKLHAKALLHKVASSQRVCDLSGYSAELGEVVRDSVVKTRFSLGKGIKMSELSVLSLWVWRRVFLFVNWLHWIQKEMEAKHYRMRIEK